MTHKLYCIYKDGNPLEGHTAYIKRNAFDKIGSAKSVVTTLVGEEVNSRMAMEFGPDYYWGNKEREKEIEAEVRKEYEVKEYTLNE